jgi:hypothetical protein
MEVDTSHSAGAIKALRPTVPARDFDTSLQFYSDLGFQSRMLTANLAEMILDAHSFPLQNHYVQDWVDNSVIHLFVSDLRLWSEHIVALDLGTRYRIKTRPPRNEGWRDIGLSAGLMSHRSQAAGDAGISRKEKTTDAGCDPSDPRPRHGASLAPPPIRAPKHPLWAER